MAALYNLLQESEREAQRAEHARVITRHVNRFHQLVIRAAAGLIGPTGIATDPSTGIQRSFWHELEEVEKIVVPNSDEALLVEQMRQCVLTAVQDLSQIKETMH